MKKIIFFFVFFISIKSYSQVDVVGYIRTNGVADYPTHIDSMGMGGYMVVKDISSRNGIPCLRRKYGMAVYVQDNQTLYILKDANCGNDWAVFSSSGGGGSSTSSNAFGSFYDSTTQTIANTTIAYPIKITKTDTAIGFHITSNRIIADSSGLYNLQWSGQFSNLNNAPQDAYVWIKKNGVNVIGSTGLIGMQARKNVSDPFHLIASWNYILPLNIGDSITFYWSATSTDVSIKYYPQSASPTKPSTASMLATITPILGGTINGGGSSLIGANGLNTFTPGEVRLGGTPIINNVQIDDETGNPKSHSVFFGTGTELYGVSINAGNIQLNPSNYPNISPSDATYNNYKLLVADTVNNWNVSSISKNILSGRTYDVLTGYFTIIDDGASLPMPVLAILENTFTGATWTISYISASKEYELYYGGIYLDEPTFWGTASLGIPTDGYATVNPSVLFYIADKGAWRFQILDGAGVPIDPDHLPVDADYKVYFELRRYYSNPL